MRRLFVVLALAVAAYAQARMKMTADQLFNFIRSSIQLHHDDYQLARYLKKIQLTDRLEDRRVEELQGMGAGPETVAALRTLSEASSSLTVTPPPPPPPPRPVIPPPDPAELAKILHDVVDKARAYAEGLPNYMCVQVTRRHYDPHGGDDWRSIDTVQEQLSYVDRQESYKVVMYNGQAVNNMRHDQLPGGGVTSSGEFGSVFTEIFAPETDTQFDWDHWATLRGRRMYVFAFRVRQSRSHYTIEDRTSGRAITAGYHGLIYADRDTRAVMRWKLECDDIPPGFPIRDVMLDMNYDFVKIADKEYVLPLKTEVRGTSQTGGGKESTWNEAEFHLYRRFAADATITFDTPDPIPSEKTEEEPAQPDSKDTKTTKP